MLIGMELFHGRSGMNRGKPVLLLWLAMVVSVAFVLVWEAVPSARSIGGSLTPILAERVHEERELRIQSLESDPFPKSPLLENNDKVATNLDDENSTGDDPIVNDDALRISLEVGPSAAPPQSTEDLPVVETEKGFSEETNADHARSSTRGDVDATQTRNETDSSEAVASFETLQNFTSMRADDGEDTTHDKAKNRTDEAEHPSASTVSAEDGSSNETTVKEDEKSEFQCDYSVGDWVLDTTRPLYSGKECAVWLSPDWACRRHHHPDKNMDRYRWQPRACDLPVFNADAALETLRNKVVAFVGDSLGRQQYQSLLCMLTRGKSYALTDVGSAFKFFTPQGARKPTGYAHRFDATNTTIVFRWTVTLARAQPMHDSNVALHLDRPEEFLEDHLRELDVLVVNSGHHWNSGKMLQNRFQFHEHGQAVPEELEVSAAYNRTVHNVVRWLHVKMRPKCNQVIYYRSLSPRHFRNGDWNTGGTCDEIRYEDGKQVQEGKRVDTNAESAIAGTNVRLLNVTSLSFLRGETHVSRYGGRKGGGQDCLHWCLPGVPDTWNEILLAEIGGKFTPRSRNPSSSRPIVKSH